MTCCKFRLRLCQPHSTVARTRHTRGRWVFRRIKPVGRCALQVCLCTYCPLFVEQPIVVAIDETVLTTAPVDVGYTCYATNDTFAGGTPCGTQDVVSESAVQFLSAVVLPTLRDIAQLLLAVDRPTADADYRVQLASTCNRIPVRDEWQSPGTSAGSCMYIYMLRRISAPAAASTHSHSRARLVQTLHCSRRYVHIPVRRTANRTRCAHWQPLHHACSGWSSSIVPSRV